MPGARSSKEIVQGDVLLSAIHRLNRKFTNLAIHMCDTAWIPYIRPSEAVRMRRVDVPAAANDVQAHHDYLQKLVGELHEHVISRAQQVDGEATKVLQGNRFLPGAPTV